MTDELRAPPLPPGAVGMNALHDAIAAGAHPVDALAMQFPEPPADQPVDAPAADETTAAETPVAKPASRRSASRED